MEKAGSTQKILAIVAIIDLIALKSPFWGLFRAYTQAELKLLDKIAIPHEIKHREVYKSC